MRAKVADMSLRLTYSSDRDFIQSRSNKIMRRFHGAYVCHKIKENRRGDSVNRPQVIRFCYVFLCALSKRK